MRLRPFLRIVVALAVVASVAGTGSFAGFSAVTESSGNEVQSGSIRLTDNDADGVVVSLADADSGGTSTGCVAVTNEGSLPAEVRLAAVVSGPLAEHLVVTITRGTGMGSNRTCTGFTPDAQDHAGLGAGVVFAGRMDTLPSHWDSAITAPAAPWAPGESHVFRVSVQLDPDGSGQGVAPSSLRLVWEGRST